MRALAPILALCTLIGSCADAPESGVSARVHALGSDGLPDSVTCIVVTVVSGGVSEPRSSTVGGLLDRDENGRPESIISSIELPDYGTPFEIRVLGRTNADGGCDGNVPGAATYVGSTGTIRLQAGERRVLGIALYERGASEFLERGERVSPRILHTATILSSGRVLVAGGFDGLEGTPCPSGFGAATECYEASAAADAYIFDPPTGQFYPVDGGMLQARGGHTATLLPDDRVLIAGGAERAIIALTPSDTEPDIQILPLDGEFLAAHATFELFSVGSDNPSLDINRDGAPGRGRFSGSSSDPERPGRLNQERFLHGAALAADRVLLAGGSGAGSPSSTYEVFDIRKPGGEGVYREEGALSVPRILPAVFTLDDEVWILGGADAATNADLGEIWDGGSPVGRSAPATRFFDTTTPQPEFGLFRPQVTTNRTGDTALITGWFGPRCDTVAADPSAPTYGGIDLVRCTTPRLDQRAFVLSDTTTSFQPQSNRSQAFAASTRAYNDTVLISGGFKSNTFETADYVMRYDFSPRYLVEYALRAQRAMHTITAVGDPSPPTESGNSGPRGFLSVGGVSNIGGTLVLTPTASEVWTWAE